MSPGLPELRGLDGLEALPPEVWNQIIASLGGPHPQEDVLAQEHMDIAALRACSLTCRSWRYFAQEHLFHFLSLTLESATCHETVSAIMEVLPSIGVYVFALAVGISWSESRRFVQQADVLNHLRIIAPMLPHVESLSLNRIDLKVPPDQLSPFPALFPALQSLYISDVPQDLNVLHAFVGACTQLRKITLLGSVTGFQSFVVVVRAQKDCVVRIQPAPPVILDTHLASVLAWMTAKDTSAPTELDVLEVSCTSIYDQWALASFVGHQAVHLRHLDIGFYPLESGAHVARGTYQLCTTICTAPSLRSPASSRVTALRADL